jgi:prepilin-type N-terminal cleavage/methylation domain-containing protein
MSSSHHRLSLRAGFTLLELLIVIAIIGIMAALAFNSFAAYRQTQRLNQSRFEVVASIERIRQYTRRYNVSYTIVFNADGTYVSTTKDSAGTALTELAGPPVTVLPQISGTLPSDMSFVTKAQGTTENEVIYAAPFGRVATAAKNCIGLKLNALGRDFGTEIHIVGVTGKVLARSINQNQTTALCP